MARGDRFDALMNYPLARPSSASSPGRHLDETVVGGHRVRASRSAARRGRVRRRVDPAAYDPAVPRVQLNLLGSHDTPRFRTVCGRRPRRGPPGDRSSQMTLPGAPCIYYGDEIGLEGGTDPGCRGAYPVDPMAGDRELRAFIRGAIALRRAHPALRSGTHRTVADDGMCHVHARQLADEWLLVAVNAGEERAVLDVAVPEVNGRTLVGERWPGLESGPTVTFRVGAGRIRLEVPARDGLVVRTS